MGIDMIGLRLRARREALGLSKVDFASLLGFVGPDVVGAIERGVRPVTQQELLRITDKLGSPLEYFLDSFRLDGESRCSWRQTGVCHDQLTAYELRANEWIAAYRSLARLVGRESRLVRPSLGLTRNSTFEDSRETGERFAQVFELGDLPSLKLRQTMEKELGILVLMVDALPGISGAAYRLPDLDAVLLARTEPEVQRHFTLAHELFHVLTWEAMPPEHSEDVSPEVKNRVEQLANKFSEAVLIPSSSLDQFRDFALMKDAKLVSKLTEKANLFQVSAESLMWRLVHAEKFPRKRAYDVLDKVRLNNEPKFSEESPPSLFSKEFAEVLHLGLTQGHISVRRAAKLIDFTIDELPEFFASHGIDYVVEL